MITYDRKIKLMDFGVIRDKSISTLTPTGSIVGTVCYTAPEQSMKHVDYRSDIFSIGTVFYEMVVGFNPFECKTYAETFLKITSLKPELPSKYNYECNDDLDGIILKAMEKNPDKRFSSARDLNDALKAFVKKYIDAI
jgi:serine/threonine-protein kinase